MNYNRNREPSEKVTAIDWVREENSLQNNGGSRGGDIYSLT